MRLNVRPWWPATADVFWACSASRVAPDRSFQKKQTPAGQIIERREGDD